MAMAPLHFAVPLGDAPMMKLLLEFWADPMKKDGYGRIPGMVPHLKGVGNEVFQAWVEGGDEAVKTWLETDDSKQASEHYSDGNAEQEPDEQDQMQAMINSGNISATGPGGYYLFGSRENKGLSGSSQDEHQGSYLLCSA
ncbi:hypothetical protein B0T21DRAFT_348692 [Apiosordaria backusii]|uniref:Uncharacterized protein n=1 Tax=Apiosordaria backusii TaxID=314023 RepID=A0AA40BM33_9PEZI|nr:hypothetical protein B0T21DRAFT_348692 [Apiosordaria backusii]